jgi:hypothetical protein
MSSITYNLASGYTQVLAIEYGPNKAAAAHIQNVCRSLSTDYYDIVRCVIGIATEIVDTSDYMLIYRGPGGQVFSLPVKGCSLPKDVYVIHYKEFIG